ncbi:uncharacterized protein LOC124160546 [Ischnura elegans]|uniref:uncharacterized protein LOC124160546 n=1 Tax=Ischnura elegans TaxID=197161 RepID=UPI001ED89186|nr:uncharacterized protein LOC124160546 [Ischnura elegans]
MATTNVCLLIALCLAVAAAMPQMPSATNGKKPSAASAPPTTAPPQFTFDILPDAGDLATRLGGECDSQVGAQAQSSSSSFSMVLPGGIAVSAAFSEARAAAGAAQIGTPSPFRGRGVSVTGPNGVTYNIRAPIEADFKVEGPEGTKWNVQRQATTVTQGAAITFPKS